LGPDSRVSDSEEKKTLSALETPLKSAERPDDARIVYSSLRILQVYSWIERTDENKNNTV